MTMYDNNYTDRYNTSRSVIKLKNIEENIYSNNNSINKVMKNNILNNIKKIKLQNPLKLKTLENKLSDSNKKHKRVLNNLNNIYSNNKKNLFNQK
jgi:hypothetical protein